MKFFFLRPFKVLIFKLVRYSFRMSIKISTDWRHGMDIVHNRSDIYKVGCSLYMCSDIILFYVVNKKNVVCMLHDPPIYYCCDLIYCLFPFVIIDRDWSRYQGKNISPMVKVGKYQMKQSPSNDGKGRCYEHPVSKTELRNISKYKLVPGWRLLVGMFFLYHCMKFIRLVTPAIST